MTVQEYHDYRSKGMAWALDRIEAARRDIPMYGADTYARYLRLTARALRDATAPADLATLAIRSGIESVYREEAEHAESCVRTLNRLYGKKA